MFDKEFYPTPKEVVEKMVKPYIKGSRYDYQMQDITILEPSAGKGDILDIVSEMCNRQGPPEFYCIEQNKELQFILNSKGYQLIGEDFLSYNNDYFFDLILMNPPFSNGDEHLLKAWDVLQVGEICCLLNSETINNPHTKRRQLLVSLIDRFGSIEELGNVFSTAERKSDVSVCMVRLTKKEQAGKLDFKFETVTQEKHFNFTEETIKNPLQTRDVVGNMIIQYEKLKEILIEKMRIDEALAFYSQGLLSSEYTSIEKIIEAAFKHANTKQRKYNRFCDGMKQQIWRIVIKKLNIEKYMTHQVRENFEKFTITQGALDFTKENVQALITMIFDNRINILEQAVVDVFDIFTKYHKENRCHVEGWKTNDNWKVNRKIILPYGCSYGEYLSAHQLKEFGGDRFKISYNKQSEYSDIDKVLCYISGVDYNRCYTISRALEHRFYSLGKVGTGSFDNYCTSDFFQIKFFKKGTIHLEFKDEKLWHEFNMRACAGKNWLPEMDKKEWEKSKQKATSKTENPDLFNSTLQLSA